MMEYVFALNISYSTLNSLQFQSCWLDFILLLIGGEMKKYQARQNCKIILIFVIWGVVNSTQALKTDEFCVDSFPLKSY